MSRRERREYMTPAMRRRYAARDQFDSGIPACWTWPLPSESDFVSPYDGSFAGGLGLMVAWQRDMCAVCGILVPYDSVTDHDHETGLIRGLLCRRCNYYESHGGLEIFDRYRHVNPASICRAEALYETMIVPKC